MFAFVVFGLVCLVLVRRLAGKNVSEILCRVGHTKCLQCFDAVGWAAARCRLAYGPADATATAVSCFSENQIGFTFLVPAYLGSPEQRAVKRVCVCACVRACVRACVCVFVLDIQPRHSQSTVVVVVSHVDDGTSTGER